ncbi:MAG: FKBP-type peptidyl-prolyl cis-trans isomerase [Bacteroidetes bacterium]|nr:FKBP-type peptidyl-prolyl cis-trans isomerase [Bacteroidota bacterium]
MKKIIPILIIIVFITLASCSKKEDMITPADQLKLDIALIQGYLASNNLTAQRTNSGLHYIITEEGTGVDKPTINHRVTVNYIGYYLDTKEVFDQSRTGSPLTILLAHTINGWIEGIPLFSKGAKGILLIPSGLAYGPFPPSGVKPNAVMIFEIELLDFFR